MTSREEFEAWYLKRFGQCDTQSGWAMERWEAWQASRAALATEIERLQRFETAHKEFSDKTDWVQETAHWSELGMHRADILRKRCDDLTSHNQAQADEIVRLRSALTSIREDSEDISACECAADALADTRKEQLS